LRVSLVGVSCVGTTTAGRLLAGRRGWPFFDLDEETGRHRRFFDIDELAGVRVEDPEVFAATHAVVLRLVGEGLVDGLRVDHPDGLADPRGYLERLRGEGVEHVWVEKILEPGEPLRDWPVEGTTGYEFANDATSLFVDPAGEEPNASACASTPARVSAAATTAAATATPGDLARARTGPWPRTSSTTAPTTITASRAVASASGNPTGSVMPA